MDTKKLSNDELKKKLTPEQYQVTQESGTDPKFINGWDNKETGMYECVVCGHPLFSSEAKYELPETDWNYGWPSFDKPVNRENVELVEDNSHGMHRIEVRCKNCGAHLGHLFSDGPKTTGEHYCINTSALNFKKQS